MMSQVTIRCATEPRGPSLLEEILDVCLAKLATRRPSPVVRAMRDEAIDCKDDIDSWSRKVPTPEIRGQMREWVLALVARIELDTE